MTHMGHWNIRDAVVDAGDPGAIAQGAALHTAGYNRRNQLNQHCADYSRVTVPWVIASVNFVQKDPDVQPPEFILVATFPDIDEGVCLGKNEHSFQVLQMDIDD